LFTLPFPPFLSEHKSHQIHQHRLDLVRGIIRDKTKALC
jgi:hypothetical protein